MSEDHSHDITKRVKIYMAVGAALIIGTIITVFAANVHLGIILGIAVAIIIATVKGSLVAGYFMHLFSERKLIYGILALTAVFIVAMVGLILLTYGDQQGQHSGIFKVSPRHVQPHAAGGGHEATHPETAKPHAVEAEAVPQQPAHQEAAAPEEAQPSQPEPKQSTSEQPEAGHVP
jgi:cytochrome c oxidase subunit 4